VGKRGQAVRHRQAHARPGRVGGRLIALDEPGTVTFEFPLLIAEGDTVVLEWRVHARTSTGTPYDNEYCGVFHVRDERICEVREYLDSRYAAQALFPNTRTSS
jgi:ketosteroid isomerase-like protein